MDRPPPLDSSFFRFSARLSWRALVHGVKALRLGTDVKGVIVSALLIAGLGISLVALWSWWQENVRWWMPVGLFLLLLYYGLLRASYGIETVKKELEEQIEIEERRATIGCNLQRLHGEGTNLKARISSSDNESSASEWEERYLAWRQNVAEYLAANVSGPRRSTCTR